MARSCRASPPTRTRRAKCARSWKLPTSAKCRRLPSAWRTPTPWRCCGSSACSSSRATSSTRPKKSFCARSGELAGFPLIVATVSRGRRLQRLPELRREDQLRLLAPEVGPARRIQQLGHPAPLVRDVLREDRRHADAGPLIHVLTFS